MCIHERGDATRLSNITSIYYFRSLSPAPYLLCLVRFYQLQSTRHGRYQQSPNSTRPIGQTKVSRTFNFSSQYGFDNLNPHLRHILLLGSYGIQDALSSSVGSNAIMFGLPYRCVLAAGVSDIFNSIWYSMPLESRCLYCVVPGSGLSFQAKGHLSDDKTIRRLLAQVSSRIAFQLFHIGRVRIHFQVNYNAEANHFGES